ncbi:MULTISPECIES: MFS transporter [unclassified Roseitalea]|uniref:MFS transporter n=1 Tax=unclassified Roseitalea TaxID=2639107 RepID=UPI00273F0531|nr:MULTISPECIES: MFS transporter [unclassified Roseitalea]
MTSAWRLTIAGFVATAVAFGPARMGFGLFLPVFRTEFALSTSMAGLIASGGFLAFLVALLATAWLGPRYGPRLPVMAGAVLATTGFAAVAAAAGPGLLAAGIALAGASAGLCWAPFNDAAERVLPGQARAGALSVISTGTTAGVLAAAGLAIAVTEGLIGWRAAWIGFALGGLALALAVRVGVPSWGRGARRHGALGAVQVDDVAAPPPSLVQRAAAPLYASAFCFGMTNAVFLSFAADRVVAAGGLPGLPDAAASTVIFFGYGLCGVLGLATGRIEARYGLAPLSCGIFAAGALSLVLIALAPTSWSGVLAASGLHGVAIMMVSALFSFWSLRLFPGRGTLGFTATLLAMAAGSVLGPALAGVLAASLGAAAMFVAFSVPPLAASLWFATRLRHARPRLPSAVRSARGQKR